MARVWLSSSRSIFENLAFEQWLLENWSSRGVRNGLLVWRNRPAVVIGRHQNPWLEADVPFLQQADIRLVRRYSGGGAVYHDEGNINFSFFTTNDNYNRLSNLNLIIDALQRDWKVTLKVNAKHDLLLDGQYKVSGTAARLTSKAAYHHLTLMVRVNVDQLYKALQSCLGTVETKATGSIRSPVKTLSQAVQLDESDVVSSVVNCYRERYSNCTVKTIDWQTERSVADALDELRSWKWIFGKTPKFKINRTLPSGQRVEITVNAGLVDKVELNKEELVTTLHKRPFDLNILARIIELLSSRCSNND